MSAVKRQPATPLPWYPAYGLTTGAVHSKPLNEQSKETRLSAPNLHRSDAAYIFHAANAYPKLVEALRVIVKGWDSDTSACINAKALLRDLGEAP